MEGIFTLPYSEYEAVNQLQKKLTKAAGYSFYVPVSRQQKGIDFIIHNSRSNKILRFQVKGSRSYLGEAHPKKAAKNSAFKYYLWFGNFLDRYESGNADYYILFGLYPEYQTGKNIKSRLRFWKSLLLCFPEREMFRFLKTVKTKKEGKPDRFFAFGFNERDEVFCVRGLNGNVDISKFLIDRRLGELKSRLG